MAKNNPKSRQAEDTNKTENSDITKTPMQTKSVPTPEASASEGYDVIKAVNRDLPVGHPERARRINNQRRDQKTQLGIGKPAIIEIE